MPSGVYIRKNKNNSESILDKIVTTLPSLCWEWTGYKDKNGYGQIGINNKIYYTHRIVYELINGSIPSNLSILHHCDNPSCCNPNHLFLGTRADNIKDMVSKGRQSKGENRPNSKHIYSQIVKIRQLYSTGKYTQKQLGEKFNLNQSNISRIITNQKWKI